MDYERVWKVLADLVNEFRKSGHSVSPGVMSELRSAKTLIQILKVDPTCTECIPRIEGCLESVEANLMSEAQEKFGADFVMEWMRRLEAARKEIYEKEMEAETARFIPGVPRGKSWMRMRASDEAPVKTIEDLAKELKLSYKIQRENYVLLCGDKKQLKSFVRKMAEKLRTNRR